MLDKINYSKEQKYISQSEAQELKDRVKKLPVKISLCSFIIFNFTLKHISLKCYYFSVCSNILMGQISS